MAKIWKRRGAKQDVWIVDVRDGEGMRHRFSAATREKADLLFAAKITEYQDPHELAGNPEMTLDDYARQWLAHLPSSELKPRTIESYEKIYNHHLAPTLGGMRMRDLRRRHVRILLTAKREEIIFPRWQTKSLAGAADPKPQRKLSKNTVRLIRACLSAMLGEAVEDELIRENPATLPSRRRGKKAAGAITTADRARAIRPLSEGELAAMLQAAREHDPEYFPLFLLLARTGLRPGEALALQWADLDLSGRKINVERAFSGGVLGTTKTDTVRTVDMSAELASALSALYVEREAQTLKCGWGDLPEWLFVTGNGKRLDESRLRKRFARVLRLAKIGGHRVYDLRHSFATALLGKGVPITYVAAQLGHSKPTTTLQWYAHWLPKSGVSFVDVLDSAGPPSTWHQSGTNPRSDADSAAPREENLAEARGDFGGPLEIRTPDPLIKSQLLCQLS